jgi:hypothetical protein
VLIAVGVALTAISALTPFDAEATEFLTLDASRDNNLLAATGIATAGRQFNDINLGGGPRLSVGLSGNADNRSIIDFDLSPLAGQYSAIQSMTMRFTYDRFGQTLDYTKAFDIDVHKITSANADWVEGTGTNSGGAADDTGSTWRHKNRQISPTPSVDWAGGDGTTANGGLEFSGVDYEATVLASLNTGTTLPADGDTIDFNFSGTTEDLTLLMDSLIADQSGFLLLTQTTGLTINQDRMRFNSREAANAALRPQLIVEFAAVPEPGAIAIWLILGLGTIVVWRAWRRSAIMPCAAYEGR